MCSVEGPPLKEKRPRPMADDQPMPIYLDHNATTPVNDLAWAAMVECRDLDIWGNPSSSHAYGLHSKFYVDRARADISRVLNADDASQIIFTSGGTESNNLAIVGTVMPRLRGQRKDIILTTGFEHDAVAKVLADLRQHHQCQVVHCPVNCETGVLDIAELDKLLHTHYDHLALVTIMHANNEIGSVQPIAEVAARIQDIAKERKVAPVPFHVDASQSIGKVPVDVKALGVDLLTVCSHKFYGPKGVGALYRRSKELPLECQTFGAPQESGQRPGTENLILVRGMAAALVDACENLEAHTAKYRALRDRLHEKLVELGVANGFEVKINGSLRDALPNTLNCALYHVPNGMYVSAHRMILALGSRVAMSAGAACHAVNGQEVVKGVSTSLRAVNVDAERAKGTLRLSTGALSTEENVDRAARLIMRAAAAQMPET